MARPLRFIPPNSIVEVTTRTVQSRLLLRPSPEVNEIVLGIIGRAQFLFSVRIHAFVVLSNHWHGLLSVDHAAQLAGFVAFVNGNIAREIGRLHDWRDRFWSRRYRAIVVADETAAVDRLRYIFKNGCQEGLVDRPVDWPGLSCVRALTGRAEMSGTWLDRTAEHHARRRGQHVIPGQFAQRFRVHLSPLPCWRNLSEACYRAACADLVAAIESETRIERVETGKPCLGRERILAQNPHDRPLASETSPAPMVHASDAIVRKDFREAYRSFVDAFRDAATRLRRGEAAEFPFGAFPPAGPFKPLEPSATPL
jgi:REP element-mobilizing transposase RayT